MCSLIHVEPPHHKFNNHQNVLNWFSKKAGIWLSINVWFFSLFSVSDFCFKILDFLSLYYLKGHFPHGIKIIYDFLSHNLIYTFSVNFYCYLLCNLELFVLRYEIFWDKPYDTFCRIARKKKNPFNTSLHLAFLTFPFRYAVDYKRRCNYMSNGSL